MPLGAHTRGPEIPSRVFALRDDVTTIGSGADVRHPTGRTRARCTPRSATTTRTSSCSGAPASDGMRPASTELLSTEPPATGTGVDLGEWHLSFFREEYADHGRPYGGRIGGELGHQRPQPSREAIQAPQRGERPMTGLALCWSPEHPDSSDDALSGADERWPSGPGHDSPSRHLQRRRRSRVRGRARCRHAAAGALDGCRAAYYLVHSLDSKDFERLDAEAARHSARPRPRRGRADHLPRWARRARLTAVVASAEPTRGRRPLGSGGVPVTVLRAGIIVGSGGISWEMTRQLVEHLPAMVTPRWVRTKTQPIAVADVVRYLVGVLDEPAAQGRVFEIGGPEVMQYVTMLRRVARSRTVPFSSCRSPCSARAVVALARPGHRRRHPDRAVPRRLHGQRSRGQRRQHQVHRRLRADGLSTRRCARHWHEHEQQKTSRQG